MIKLVTIDPMTRLTEILELWNHCMADDFHLSHRLLTQQLTLDTDPKKCFAFEASDGKLVAIMLVKKASRAHAKKEAPQLGYISVVLVDKTYRRQGLADKLFHEALAWLTSLGVKKIRAGADYYHFFPGKPDPEKYQAVSCFLAKHGFVDEATEYDLIGDISNNIAQANMPAGYTCRYYRPTDKEALFYMLNSNFAGRWTSDMEEALNAGMRNIDLVVAVNKFDKPVGFSRIYDENSPVIGPSLYWSNSISEKTGGLGPIGIDSEQRGHGLGLAILQHCIHELHMRGIKTMLIDWTDLLDFYGKLGFKIWKKYILTSLQI